MRLGLADGVAAWGDFVRAFVAQVTPPPTKADHDAAWETAVTRRMQNRRNPDQAITATATSDPELHTNYLAEFNARQRAVARN